MIYVIGGMAAELFGGTVFSCGTVPILYVFIGMRMHKLKFYKHDPFL